MKRIDRSREAARLFDRVVNEYVRAFFEDLSDARELDRFARMLPRGAKVLDAGCGPGNFAKYLINFGLHVTGIDLSKGMIRAARSLVPEGTFRIMDVRRLGFRDQEFDGVLAAYSFVHIPKREAGDALHEVRRVLRPGGTLLFIVKQGRGERLVKSSLKRNERIFVKYWQVDEAQRLLRQCGFRILSCRMGQPATPEELQRDKIFIFARRKAR